MLAREFISSSLYQSGQGYFNSAARVWRSDAPETMRFNDLYTRDAYYRQLKTLYGVYDDCWLTPVEIFKPFYAQAIARWVVDTRRKDLGPNSVPEMNKPEWDGKVEPTETTTSTAAMTDWTPGKETAGRDARPTTQSTQATAPPSASSPPSSASSSSSSPSSSPSAVAPLAPLRILEIGGGNGTCALGILDYLERHYPELYRQTEYTIVELSEFMIETQRETLEKHLTHHTRENAAAAAAAAGGSTPSASLPGITSSPRVRLLNMSIIDWRELRADSTVFVIGLEVLDNMPHDRLRWSHATASQPSALQQVHVVSGNTRSEGVSTYQTYQERLGPINDPWIIEYGQYWQHFAGPAAGVAASSSSSSSSSSERRRRSTTLKDALTHPDKTLGLWFSEATTRLKQRIQSEKSVWFPTTSLQLLHVVREYLPSHHLLLADFHHLPSTVEGDLGPVVSAKSKRSRGETVDFDTYLVHQGDVDIFFPTDFEALRYVYRRVVQRMDHQQVEEAENRDKAAAREQPPPPAPAAAAGAASSPPRAIVAPRVLSQYEFMQLYAAPSAAQTKTKSGWNPIAQDYVNFSFFLA